MKKKVLELPTKLKAIVEKFGSVEFDKDEIGRVVAEFIKLDDTMRIRFFNDLWRASVNGWNTGVSSMTSGGFSRNMFELHKHVKPMIDAAVKKLRPDLVKDGSDPENDS